MNFIQKKIMLEIIRKEIYKPMYKYKNFTHILAVVVTGLWYFLHTKSGVALTGQYHVVSSAAELIGTLYVLYHAPLTDATIKKISGGAAIIIGLFLFSSPVHAQTATNVPTPTQSTFNLSIGGNVVGVGGTSSATPASDVQLTLNPGIKSLPGLELRSDNTLAPSVNWQGYFGGINYELPYHFSSVPLSNIRFYFDGSAGITRIVPASGPSISNVGFQIGAGMRWIQPNGVKVTLGEFNLLHDPHSPFGSTNAPEVIGGISYLWGSH